MKPATQQSPAHSEVSMSDLAPLLTAHTIVRLEQDPQGLTLHWDDGRQDRLHALWLRDNCACPQCRHPQALERTFMFIDHPLPALVSALLGTEGALEVSFQAGGEAHVSKFSTGWLRAHACTAVPDLSNGGRVLWDASLSQRLPTVEYADYIATGEGLRHWIEALQSHGIVLLRGVPTEPEQLLEVTRRIGPVRTSNFGDFYDVVSMPNPNASAYTSLGLELHTDLANWHSPPDIQLLFCLKSSVTGGDSVFADGFRVAQDLRVEDPAAFELLSTHDVEFRFHDANCDIRARAPTIAASRDGQLQRIRFNNWLRSPMVMADNLVGPMYAALDRFWRMLRDPHYRLQLRLEPGCLIAYDNSRVLHGRTAFDPRSGERHLRGCYLTLDDLQSTLRLLERSPLKA
jgi:gamma-butyrobetaine dioxygenase